MHYCAIKDMSPFIKKSGGHKALLCHFCFLVYRDKKAYDKHRAICKNKSPAQRVKMPSEENKILKFKAWEKTLPSPYIIVYDFETIIKKIEQPEDLINLEEIPDELKNSHPQISTKSFTEVTAEHQAVSYCLVVKDCINNKIIEKITYVQESENHQPAAVHFLENLTKIGEKLVDKIRKDSHSKMKLSTADEIAFQNAKICSICKEPVSPGREKHRDHDHLKKVKNMKDPNASNYRGPAHGTCNRRYHYGN